MPVGELANFSAHPSRTSLLYTYHLSSLALAIEVLWHQEINGACLREWNPSNDLPNEEKNQYRTAY